MITELEEIKSSKLKNLKSLVTNFKLRGTPEWVHAWREGEFSVDKDSDKYSLNTTYASTQLYPNSSFSSYHQKPSSESRSGVAINRKLVQTEKRILQEGTLKFLEKVDMETGRLPYNKDDFNVVTVLDTKNKEYSVKTTVKREAKQASFVRLFTKNPGLPRTTDNLKRSLQIDILKSNSSQKFLHLDLFSHLNFDKFSSLHVPGNSLNVSVDISTFGIEYSGLVYKNKTESADFFNLTAKPYIRAFEYSASKNFGPTTSIWSFLRFLGFHFRPKKRFLKVAFSGSPYGHFYEAILKKSIFGRKMSLQKPQK